MVYIYHPPTLTVDCVIFQIIDNKLQVLLIQRANDPFRNAWALPGGYNAAGNTMRQALSRALTTKTGIDLDNLTLLEQLYAFDTVSRDPRGPAISITYVGLCRDLELTPREGTQHPTFYVIDNLPPLAYDHANIVQYAYEYLRAKISETTAVAALIPKQFTLTQLQTAYEIILSRPLDKRNFRKKYLSLNILKPTEQYQRDGAHRPALLYSFPESSPQTLLRDFR